MMHQAPEHAALASYPAASDDLDTDRDHLDALILDTAQYLLEGDWLGAAKSAYRAAWRYHRLPASDQRTYVASDWHDDDGPQPVADDWSSSAFVAWLIYRIGVTAKPYARKCFEAHNNASWDASVESEQKGLGL